MRALTLTAQAVHQAYPRPSPRSVMPERLARSDLLSLQLAHVDALDRIARGRATPQEMWDWVANCLTWSRVADLMELGQHEMREQLQLALGLLVRWRRTGRVAFDGPGYQLAKHGVDVMDELARHVDTGTAHEAALWTERELARLQDNLERKAA